MPTRGYTFSYVQLDLPEVRKGSAPFEFRMPIL